MPPEGEAAGHPSGLVHFQGLCSRARSRRAHYDMSVNVWEWCADWYKADYYTSKPPADDPSGPARGNERVMRGGAVVGAPATCTSRYRTVNKERCIGLREACEVKGT